MLGGGNVNFIPIAMSLATTFFSAIAVLGIPAEFYIYGTMYTYFLVPYLICTILSAEIFGPIYMDMGLTSTYEYLEVRFLNWSRKGLRNLTSIQISCIKLYSWFLYSGLKKRQEDTF